MLDWPWYWVSAGCVTLSASSLEYWLDTCCSINATKLQRDDRFRTIKYSALIRNTINSLGLVSTANAAVWLREFQPVVINVTMSAFVFRNGYHSSRSRTVQGEISDNRKSLRHEKRRTSPVIIKEGNLLHTKRRKVMKSLFPCKTVANVTRLQRILALVRFPREVSFRNHF